MVCLVLMVYICSEKSFHHSNGNYVRFRLNDPTEPSPKLSSMSPPPPPPPGLPRPLGPPPAPPAPPLFSTSNSPAQTTAKQAVPFGTGPFISGTLFEGTAIQIDESFEEMLRNCFKSVQTVVVVTKKPGNLVMSNVTEGVEFMDHEKKKQLELILRHIFKNHNISASQFVETMSFSFPNVSTRTLLDLIKYYPNEEEIQKIRHCQDIEPCNVVYFCNNIGKDYAYSHFLLEIYMDLRSSITSLEEHDTSRVNMELAMIELSASDMEEILKTTLAVVNSANREPGQKDKTQFGVEKLFEILSKKSIPKNKEESDSLTLADFVSNLLMISNNRLENMKSFAKALEKLDFVERDFEKIRNDMENIKTKLKKSSNTILYKAYSEVLKKQFKTWSDTQIHVKKFAQLRNTFKIKLCVQNNIKIDDVTMSLIASFNLLKKANSNKKLEKITTKVAKGNKDIKSPGLNSTIGRASNFKTTDLNRGKTCQTMPHHAPRVSAAMIPPTPRLSSSSSASSSVLPVPLSPSSSTSATSFQQNAKTSENNPLLPQIVNLRPAVPSKPKNLVAKFAAMMEEKEPANQISVRDSLPEEKNKLEGESLKQHNTAHNESNNEKLLNEALGNEQMKEASSNAKKKKKREALKKFLHLQKK